MYRKTFVAAVAAAVSLTLLGSAPAQAADSVTIKKISSKTAAYKKSVKVRPSVSTSGRVKLSAKTFTIKKGKKTVAKNKTAANLKAGTYSVKTTVKYKVFRYVRKSVLTVNAGETIYPYDYSDAPGFEDCVVTRFGSAEDFDFTCQLHGLTVTSIDATRSDIRSTGSLVRPEGVGEYLDVQSLRSPVNLYVHQTVREYGRTRTKARSQSLKIKQGAKPANCATYKNFKKVKDGMTTSRVKSLLGPSKVQYSSGGYVNREYKPCDKYDYYVVLFEDGYVWDKMYANL